jgi:hypothetical protein
MQSLQTTQWVPWYADGSVFDELVLTKVLNSAAVLKQQKAAVGEDLIRAALA